MPLYFPQKLVARNTRTGRIAVACFSFLSVYTGPGTAEETASGPELPPPLPVQVTAAETARAGETRELSFPVRQIRVRGAKILSEEEIADAIYPYLGMGRTLDDLEAARAALEKTYRDKGYETVGVELPVQNGTRGIIYMDAVENSVGRLRVRGAKYFLPGEVKKNAPSLQEGTVPDFARVQEDIVKLNAWSDRKVTPSLLPGRTPGTIDVDLLVEDSLPLHGSIELNNRYSAGTTPLRLNGSVNYDNLWQLGHTLGLSTQIAPERIEDAEVYSAFYIARFARTPNFSILLSGTKQNSDVSTLGGAAVAGRGEVAGIRALITLPGRGKYFHSLSTGFDYKKFEEDVVLDGETFSTPIDYWPASLAYSGGWVNEKSFTELNALASWNFRGPGSSAIDFDTKRFDADGSYLYFRGDVSHTQDFDNGFQAFGKIQGQATSNALINSEQYSGGGTSTVRGYLESEALADSGWFLTAEIRSPSLLRSGKDDEETLNREWRFHAFWDGGRLYLNHPLPEQIDMFPLSSLGVGTRFSLNDALEGSVEVAWPLQDQGATQAGEPFVTFQVEAGF